MDPEPTDPSPGRRARRRASTRRALIDAAISVVAEAGVDAPVRDITDSADVGVGTLYNHFGDRETLLDAAADDIERRLVVPVERTVAELDDPAERLAAAIRLLILAIRADPISGKSLMILSEHPAGVRRSVGPRLAALLEHGISSGRFTVASRPATQALLGGGFRAHVLGAVPDDGPAHDIAFAVAALQSLGLAPDEATEIAHRPLPHP